MFLALLIPGSGFVAVPLAAQAGSSASPGALVAGNLDSAPRPHAAAARATGRIRIDARLDDPTWASAPVIDRFIQQIPVAGAPASERTEVRILYDDENLYIGAELYDSNPSGIINTTLQRNPSTAQGDALGFTFDTFLDGQNGYVFFVIPEGPSATCRTPRARDA